MALIRCTECGQMISDKASRCPKCGNPIMQEGMTNMNQQPMDQQPLNQQPVYNDEGNGGNSNKWLFAIIALLLLALAGGGYYFYDKNKQVEQEMQQQQQKLIADSIARDSIAKVEEIRQDSIEQARSAAETKQKAQEQKAVAAAPQFYGQVSDPDGYTNIRRGPGTNYPIVRQYNSGDYLYYSPQSNGWSLVYSGVKANTFMGYMHTSRIIKIDPNQGSSYSSSSSSSSNGNYHEGYIVDPVDDYVNVRKGPGTNYAIVGRLDTYTDVYYTTTGSSWYKVYDGNYNYLGYVYYNRIKKTR